MSAVATAVVGSAVIGAYASNRAADKAASASEKGIESSNALANQARTDAINLFQQARTSGQGGINAALNFYKNTSNTKIAPYVSGNIAAQQVLGKGATAAQNAILGLPVDMSFANAAQKAPADYSAIKNVKLPTLGASPLSTTSTPSNTATSSGGQGNASGVKRLLGGALGNNVLGNFRGIF